MKPNQLPAIVLVLMLVSNIKTAHSMEITPLMEQLDQQNNIVTSEISDKQEKDESFCVTLAKAKEASILLILKIAQVCMTLETMENYLWELEIIDIKVLMGYIM